MTQDHPSFVLEEQLHPRGHWRLASISAKHGPTWDLAMLRRQADRIADAVAPYRFGAGIKLRIRVDGTDHVLLTLQCHGNPEEILGLVRRKHGTPEDRTKLTCPKCGSENLVALLRSYETREVRGIEPGRSGGSPRLVLAHDVFEQWDELQDQDLKCEECRLEISIEDFGLSEDSYRVESATEVEG